MIGIVSTLAIHPIGKKDACIENMPVTMHVASFGSTKAARTDGRTDDAVGRQKARPFLLYPLSVALGLDARRYVPFARLMRDAGGEKGYYLLGKGEHDACMVFWTTTIRSMGTHHPYPVLCYMWSFGLLALALNFCL